MYNHYLRFWFAMMMMGTLFMGVSTPISADSVSGSLTINEESIQSGGIIKVRLQSPSDAPFIQQIRIFKDPKQEDVLSGSWPLANMISSIAISFEQGAVSVGTPFEVTIDTLNYDPGKYYFTTFAQKAGAVIVFDSVDIQETDPAIPLLIRQDVLNADMTFALYSKEGQFLSNLLMPNSQTLANDSIYVLAVKLSKFSLVKNGIDLDFYSTQGTLQKTQLMQIKVDRKKNLSDTMSIDGRCAAQNVDMSAYPNGIALVYFRTPRHYKYYEYDGQLQFKLNAVSVSAGTCGVTANKIIVGYDDLPAVSAIPSADPASGSLAIYNIKLIRIGYNRLMTQNELVQAAETLTAEFQEATKNYFKINVIGYEIYPIVNDINRGKVMNWYAGLPKTPGKPIFDLTNPDELYLATLMYYSSLRSTGSADLLNDVVRIRPLPNQTDDYYASYWVDGLGELGKSAGGVASYVLVNSMYFTPNVFFTTTGGQTTYHYDIAACSYCGGTTQGYLNSIGEQRTPLVSRINTTIHEFGHGLWIRSINVSTGDNATRYYPFNSNFVWQDDSAGYFTRMEYMSYGRNRLALDQTYGDEYLERLIGPFSCGDGICSLTEDGVTCPIDCRQSICGDGICQTGEDNNNCAIDCPSLICALGTYAGLCTECDGNGGQRMSVDDPACGAIDCSALDYYLHVGSQSPTDMKTCILRSYAAITSNRCEGLSDCKDANTVNCTSYTDMVQYACGTCQYIAASDCTGTSRGGCTNHDTTADCGIKGCDTFDTICRDYHDVTRYCDGAGGCTDSMCNFYTDLDVTTVCGIKDCDVLDTPCRDYHDVMRHCDGAGGCTDPVCDAYTDAPVVTSVGVCAECDGRGGIRTAVDDQSCGVLSCSNLDFYYQAGTESPTTTETCVLRNYADITSNRCEGLNVCKSSTPDNCTNFIETIQYVCGICQYIDPGSCTSQTPGSCSNYAQGVSCGVGNVCDGNGGCVPMKCGAPPTYANATVGSGGSNYGDMLTVSCNSGYTGSPMTIICGDSGIWIGSGPVCVVVPDLTTSSLSTTATAVTRGSSFTLSNTATNQGMASAGGFTVAFSLSKDAVYGGTDDIVFSATRSVTSLAAGATSSASTTLTVPTTTPLGNYYVCAKADSGNTVTESDEANNGRCTTSTIQIALPDLVMTQINGPSNAATGTSISLLNAVKNQGASSMSSFYVGFYLSTDAAITTGDIRIGTRSISSLAAGASNNATTSVTVPTTLAAGTYYIGVIADPSNTRAETNETNNALTGNVIVLTIGADLVINSVSGPVSAIRGTTVVTLSSILVNQGVGGTAPFYVGLYLSTDATITTSDIYMGRGYFTSLSPGFTATASTVITIPTSVSLGTYYVGAIADYTNTVKENNETNNARAGNTIVVQ